MCRDGAVFVPGICLLAYIRVCLFLSMFFVRVLLRSLTTLLTTVSKFFKQFVFAVNTRVPILQLFPKKGRKRDTLMTLAVAYYKLQLTEEQLL
ncbi:hypothetical protein B5X24_HaOG213554 [Helicoverpa armigera]|nr:hypothetical protein B5X24_HaOG213554 [Helicoverpa armigera]